MMGLIVNMQNEVNKMKKIIVLILAFVMCLSFAACNETPEENKSMRDIQEAIYALPKGSYLIDAIDSSYGTDLELDKDFKGKGKIRYLIYDAVMINGELVASDYNKPILVGCEIIVYEFEFAEDAELFAQKMAETLNSAKEESDEIPDWIIKVSGGIVVMAKDQQNLDLVW